MDSQSALITNSSDMLPLNLQEIVLGNPAFQATYHLVVSITHTFRWYIQ